MGRIHGSAYLIIGFFVSFVSWVFDFQKLIVFFGIGAIMALYGGARVGFDVYEFYKEKKERQGQMAGQQPAQQQAMHPSAQAPHQQSQHRSTVKHCKKCGTASHFHAKFCHACGHTGFHLRT
ncbi:MAG: hypothetical protein QF632_03275 [Candidatus Woesearchaeota archaeon]|jgi:membrane protease subunit (stomatin/prohibitin family)|nr:hypothetical protein [Candidatus Woesearchaeota archaeon]MDP7323756.1 hypothetical protein [Candidatus Woesearchaeota archaeon]MDP7458062.1 hypothetical protein [Candidatus Woesearchaeota archaeon]